MFDCCAYVCGLRVGWLELNGHADAFVSLRHSRLLGLVPNCLRAELVVVLDLC